MIMKKVKNLFMYLIVRLLTPVWFLWGVLIGIYGASKGMTTEEIKETYIDTVIYGISRE